MATAHDLMTNLNAAFRRLRQQETIDALRLNLARQQTALRLEREKSQEIDAVHEAAWTWLQARIAYSTAAPTLASDGPDGIVAFAQHLNTAEEALDKATRKAFMHPGMRGSWGRGVSRDWACSFDPQNGGPLEGGCECAGHGRSEETSRECHYRVPIEEKVGDPVTPTTPPHPALFAVMHSEKNRETTDSWLRSRSGARH